MRTFARTAGVGFLYLVASAHVGSPDTWFEGNAGPYHLTVQVQTAGVVPGVATVFVRAPGEHLDRVTIQANKFDATGGAPPPEIASPVAGDAGAYTGKLWMMTGGSNSVTVYASGEKGSGKIIVPVVVVAYSRLKLDKPMGVGLAAMGVFLFAGLVTIVGSAFRESMLVPGEAPSAASRNRARMAMTVTAIVLAVAITGGWKWWGSEDAAYVKGMYKSLTAQASLASIRGAPAIDVAITEPSWVHRGDTAWIRKERSSSWTPLVADHGKLMHVFVIRDDLSAFAHLHPGSADSVSFLSVLPPLPAGRYRVFSDIVHESGFTHTLVSALTIPASSPVRPSVLSDPDDSWFTAPVRDGVNRVNLDDGSSIEWTRGTAPIRAGTPAPLHFAVRNADGTPASIEAYMGMAGHAVVTRSDGSVFVHLHPTGTISMASQMAFSMREPGDTIRGRLGKRLTAAELAMAGAAIQSNIVSFPYAFPRPGEYRIWVQVKKGGKIQTAAFDVPVVASVI